MAGTDVARCVRDTTIVATFNVRITAKTRDFGENSAMGEMLHGLSRRVCDTLQHEMGWSDNSIEPTDVLREVVSVELLDISDEQEVGPSRRLPLEEVEEVDFSYIG